MEIFAVIDFPGYRCARVFPLSTDRGAIVGGVDGGGRGKQNEERNWELEREGGRERERMRKKREKSGIQYIFSVNNRGRKKGGGMDPLLLLDFFFNYGYSERKR